MLKNNIMELTNEFLFFRKQIYDNKIKKFENNTFLININAKLANLLEINNNFPISIFTLIKLIIIKNNFDNNYIILNDKFQNYFKCNKITFDDLIINLINKNNY